MRAGFSGKHRVLCCIILFSIVLSFTLSVVPVSVYAEQTTVEDVTYEYEILPDETVRILNVTDAPPHLLLTVPEILDGYTVTAIGPGFLKKSVSEEGTFAPISIPNTVTDIDPLFIEGIKLKGSVAYFGPVLVIDPEHPVYSYVFQDSTGCLIDHTAGRLISVVDRSSNVCTIPEGVKILGDNCFHGQYISELSLPASLAVIEPQSLQSADEIVDISIAADNAVFFAYQGQLRDHKERVYYPFTQDFPEEGYYIDPTLSPEEREAQQKQERRENAIGNILGVLLIAIVVILLITFIVQMIRRDGHLTLKKIFSELQQITSGTALLACSFLFVVLFRTGKEFGEIFSAFGFFSYALVGIIIVYGILGVIVDFIVADTPFWAVMTVLLRLFLLPIVYVLLAMEGLLNTICLLVLIAFAFLIVIRGAIDLSGALGFTRLYQTMEIAADAMDLDSSVYLTPSDELQDFRIETPMEDTTSYWGPDGEFYNVKTTPLSRDVTVTVDGETVTGKRMADGSIRVEKPKKSTGSSGKDKWAPRPDRRGRVHLLLSGILSLLPYLLLLGSMIAQN